MWDFPLFPEQASSLASQVDELYLFELAIAGFFTVLICLLIVSFAVVYRRRSRADRSNPPVASRLMEVIWIVVPLLLGLVMFAWGARLFFKLYQPPGDALDIAVVGKQWMWHLQHPEGRSEINELHIPLGKADQADDDLARRDPQFLRPRVPGEAGRLARALHDDVVRAVEGRALSSFLCRVLRHESFDDEGIGHGDGARGLSKLAVAGRRRAFDGGGGRASLRAAPLRGLPPRQPDGACTEAGGGFRAAGADSGGARGSLRHGRCRLHSRLDPLAQGPGGGRIRAGRCRRTRTRSASRIS